MGNDFKGKGAVKGGAKEKKNKEPIENSPADQEELPEKIHQQLRGKFHIDDIEWVVVNAYKAGKGVKAFAKPYIKKESAENRADDVFGTFGWRDDFSMPDAQGRFKYKIEVKDPDSGLWIAKHVAGSIDMKASGGFSDAAFETALSFAEKRAWSKLGIGRYLKLIHQTQVVTSLSFKAGWNYRAEGKKTPAFNWQEPQLPPDAMHPDDSYDGRPHQEPEDDPNPPQEIKMATDGQWDRVMAYYNALPEAEQGRWDQYIFTEQVDDETGEVIQRDRRRLPEEYIIKVIASLREGYGELNANNVPEKIADQKADQPPPPPGNPDDEEVRKIREGAQAKQENPEKK